MRRGGGKAKGSENERELCKYLSKWWTGKETPIVFWRVGSSGAQFTLSGGTTEMSGDVVAIHPEGSDFCEIFSVETKFVKQFDFSDLIHPEKKWNQLESWWDQCKGDAEKVGRNPLLLFRRNGMKHNSYYFMMEKELFDRLNIDVISLIISKNRIVGLFDDIVNSCTKQEILESLKWKN